jgi:hypothetical protein
MNQREKLEAEAEGYRKGYARALEISKAEIETREKQAYEQGVRMGRRIGRNQILKEVEGVQWGKLFGVVVAASTIGCGIILALALGLSYL